MNLWEAAVLGELYEKHLGQYRSDEASARELLGVGLQEVPAKPPVAELAATTSLARVILNLHETITRY